MSSEVASPETLGPQIVSYVDWLIDRAESVERTQPPQARSALGEITEDLCRHYRALAICLFADDANVDDLYHWLLHSPLTRKHYLSTVHGHGFGDARYGRLSFVDPVLDAMAARQWPLARAISSMASDAWLEGDEYEDDFCYGKFLRSFLSGVSTDAVLARWRQALEGGGDPRLDVAEALRTMDSAGFEESLRALLRANEGKARTMADPNTPSLLASDYPFAPNRWISIEGLALLALAERNGLATDYECEGCPTIARKQPYAPFRPRAYPNLDVT